jgi:hypothetical protein
VVEQVGNRSTAILEKFEDGTSSILAKIRANATKTTRGLLVLTALFSAIGPTVAVLAVWLVLAGLPSVDEIQKRRLEVQSLSVEINDLSAKKEKENAEVERLRGRLVFTNGQWYARYDTAPVSLCVDPNRQETSIRVIPVLTQAV